jgi:type VI secretion system protein ImpF
MNPMPASALSLVPLFDRLDGELAASADGRTLDGHGLQQSLQLDLTRLFNSRNGLTIEQFLGGAPTALNYGLPDMLGLSSQSAGDLARWELVMVRALALYEPRLYQVQVTIRADRASPVCARVTIAAAALVGRQLRQVHFDVLLDQRSATLAAA